MSKTSKINNSIDLFGMSDNELNNLINDTENIGGDNINGDICLSDDPIANIDIDEVDEEARSEASEITQRLSGYYFDQKYIDTHPYIPVKIKCEMNNIRRLLKMLQVNEIAQDSLIKNISLNAGKGSLYSSLTSLQNATLAIQAQLTNLTESLENIFKKMQEECEKSWTDKEKQETEDGTVVVRGSREFISMLMEQNKSQNSTTAN